MMRTGPLLALLLVAATYAERPVEGMSTSKLQAQGEPNLANACMVLCADDPLDPANHFGCEPTGAGVITTHVVPVPSGGGHVCMVGVVVNTLGIVSDPSVDQKLALDVPGRPQMRQ